VRRISLFCISIAVVAVAWTEPSPTPSHIVSRILRQPVESSAIAKVGYSKRHHILEIEFINGAVYRYLDVPATVYRNLMAADSKARFYDSNIKRHYHSIVIQSRQKERLSAKSPE
jgi:KTSC domain